MSPHNRRTLRLRLRGISQPVVHGSTRPASGAADGDASQVLVEADEVVRDAEESLVAALQESDTALEALHDAEADHARGPLDSRRVRITLAGVVLAALTLLVTRRRS